MGDITRYLLVRDADGAILDELESPAAALEALESGRDRFGGQGISVVRFAEHQGQVVGTTSLVTTRLAGFDGRPARARRSNLT